MYLLFFIFNFASLSWSIIIIIELKILKNKTKSKCNLIRKCFFCILILLQKLNNFDSLFFPYICGAVGYIFEDWGSLLLPACSSFGGLLWDVWITFSSTGCAGSDVLLLPGPDKNFPNLIIGASNAKVAKIATKSAIIISPQNLISCKKNSY